MSLASLLSNVSAAELVDASLRGRPVMHQGEIVGVAREVFFYAIDHLILFDGPDARLSAFFHKLVEEGAHAGAPAACVLTVRTLKGWRVFTGCEYAGPEGDGTGGFDWRVTPRLRVSYSYARDFDGG